MIGTGAASFALCLLATLMLRPVAVAIDLIDRPGGRKTHVGDIPIVGGLAMLLGVVFGLGFVPMPDASFGVLLSACTLLVTVGLVDDRFGLPSWLRLIVQTSAALMLTLGAGISVVTFGAPFGPLEIWLDGFVSTGFTIVAIVAAINAFNMLDGMDGLAGAMAIVAFVAMAAPGHDAGLYWASQASVVMIGAIGAFLLSNVPIGINREVRCFMGDSGSTLLGFCVAWMCITISQSPAEAAAPVTILWAVALPLYELFWTVIRRAIRGVSPFKPDTDHLHHRLRDAGFSVRGAFILFAGLAALLAGCGAALEWLGIADRWSFLLLIVAGIGVVRLIYRAELILRVLPDAGRTLLARSDAALGPPKQAT